MTDQSKHEKMWRQAHNLCSAFDELRNMRELFKNAADAEKVLDQLDKNKERVEKTISALKKTEQALHLRCKDEADQIKSQREQSKSELEAMKQQYLDRYEAEYGKLVITTKEKFEAADRQIESMQKVIKSKSSQVAELDKQIRHRETQIETLDAQFKKIGQAFTQEA